jgi:hypothetical protein
MCCFQNNQNIKYWQTIKNPLFEKKAGFLNPRFISFRMLFKRPGFNPI